MKKLLTTTFSTRLERWIDSNVWYAIVAVPALIIVGKILTLPIGSFSYEITLSEIVIGLVSVGCIGYLISPWYKKGKWHATPLGHALVLLFLLNLVSVFWVENLEKWVIALRVLTFQFATFFLAANLLKTKRQCMIALSVLLVPAVSCVIYIAYAVHGIPYDELLKLNRSWLTTPLGALSYVAAMVAMFVPVVLALYHMSVKKAYRIITSLVYIVLVAALLYAAGKAAILSALCGLLCMLFFVKQRRVAVIGFTLCAVVLFFGLTSVKQEGGGAVLLGRFENISTDLSTQFRLLEINAATHIFLASPLIGQGAGNLKVAYQHYTGFYDGEANNIIMQYIAEFGLLGLILFGYAIHRLLNLYSDEYLMRQKKDPLMFALFSSFLVTTAINAMFEVTIVGLIYGILFFYCIGIFSAYSRTRS